MRCTAVRIDARSSAFADFSAFVDFEPPSGFAALVDEVWPLAMFRK
jgi:hypothetical protein